MMMMIIIIGGTGSWQGSIQFSVPITGDQLLPLLLLLLIKEKNRVRLFVFAFIIYCTCLRQPTKAA